MKSQFLLKTALFSVVGLMSLNAFATDVLNIKNVKGPQTSKSEYKLSCADHTTVDFKFLDKDHLNARISIKTVDRKKKTVEALNYDLKYQADPEVYIFDNGQCSTDNNDKCVRFRQNSNQVTLSYPIGKLTKEIACEPIK